VGPVAVPVEDPDELGRAIDGGKSVRGHGRELGGLPGLDDDLAFTERQADASLDDEEPVVAGVDPRLRRLAARFEPHLQRDGGAGRAAEQPGGAPTRAARCRADDHVVVAAHVEQGVEVDLERGGQRQQDVEADRPLAGLDPADRRRTEVGAGGELVERQAQRLAKAPQPGPHHLFDLVELGHLSPHSLRIVQEHMRIWGDIVSSGHD
jgi:hypothetical protein